MTIRSKEQNSLAIALGANIPSQAGTPISTLIAVRPLLEKVIHQWLFETLNKKVDITKHSDELRWHWSPMYETNPVGGPTNQDPYINAVLVVDGKTMESKFRSCKIRS